MMNKYKSGWFYTLTKYCVGCLTQGMGPIRSSNDPEFTPESITQFENCLKKGGWQQRGSRWFCSKKCPGFYTEEQKQHFWKRTLTHIFRVKRNVLTLIENDFPVDTVALLKQAHRHDETKFHDPEFSTYIEITWMYYCRRTGSEFIPFTGFKKASVEATLHHVTNNPHHPEYYTETAAVNSDDRDAPPAEMVDGTSMTDVGLVEMCCDWVAMSQELLGHSSAHEWAKNNINVRWKFSSEQVSRIYETLGALQRLLDSSESGESND